MERDALRILVVDDHHLILRLLVMMLEGAGHVALGVESGALGLMEAQRDPPDVCIVDEIMPGLSGSETIRAFRASADLRVSGLPIIGISGRTGSREALLAAGADAFLAKPIDEKALLATLAAILSARPRTRAGQPAA